MKEPKIPKARKILEDALDYQMDNRVRIGILEALRLMHRERYKRVRSPVSSKKINPELRDEIKYYVRNRPRDSTTQVAQRFGVNPGRVSEILAGDYD